MTTPVGRMTPTKVRLHAADVLADCAGLFLAERSTGNAVMLGEALRLFRLAVLEDTTDIAMPE